MILDGKRLTIPIRNGSQTGLTIDNTVGGIGLTVPTGMIPHSALITVYTAPVRFWPDGKAPTATTGHRADVYSRIILESDQEIADFRAIRETGISADFEVTYYLD